jgi:SAM-dependent methyltransferase
MHINEIKEAYDRHYQTPNYFRDRRWLYRSFVGALVRKARLAPNANLLDAGCGQGFFTSLFAERGMLTLGVDLSSIGIAIAERTYGSSIAKFQIGNILELPFEKKYDCVFTRSCSLYNTDTFSSCTRVTDQLLRYVKPGGVLIFDYHTRLVGNLPSANWRYHNIAEAIKHFSRYPVAEVYFSLRLETCLIGKFGFSPLSSRFSQHLSRTLGIGGELVAFVRRVDT